VPLTEKDVAFAKRALNLKRVTRAGWTRVPNLVNPESVADHSYGVTLLTLLATKRDPSVDAARALTIAIAHDLAEAVIGDLTPGDYVDAAEKHAREERGLLALLAGVDEPVRHLIEDAWREYEEGDSREARLVRDLDKVEMALQARVYAEEGVNPEDLREFWGSALNAVDDAGLSQRVAALKGEEAPGER
jgi:putative hydrolases of HD superfamily